jgi:Zn-dependent protease
MEVFSKMGRFFKVRLRVQRSWALVFILMTAVVVTEFPNSYPMWQRIALGLAASFLFFAAVSIRELVINAMAVFKGVPLYEVRLYFLGGVSNIAKEETSPNLELLLALTGMLLNMATTGTLYAIHVLLVNAGSVLIDGMILWLAYAYVLLTIFHFVPILPLDGGRLLRALLWKATGRYNGPTSVLGWAGQVAGFMLIIGGGLLIIFGRQWVNGLTLAMIGWILNMAASQSHRPVVVRRALEGVLARDAMVKQDPMISQQLSVGQLVRECVLVDGRCQFVVAEESRILGMVTMDSFKSVPRKRWDQTTVANIMTPVKKVVTARAEQPAATLLEKMDAWRLECMPVLEGEKVIGLVDRDSLRRLAETRRKFKR